MAARDRIVTRIVTRTAGRIGRLGPAEEEATSPGVLPRPVSAWNLYPPRPPGPARKDSRGRGVMEVAATWPEQGRTNH
jgi:hypothetical protein